MDETPGDRARRFKRHQRQMRSIGDQGALSEQFRLAAEDVVRRLDIGPRMRVLDIATGTGNAALAAASRGAEVAALDLTPELFDEARWRQEELQVTVDWRQGDAEALPYADADFDRVTSVFGMMFVPRPGLACAELVRVLRPGGRFGLCNWTLRGAVLEVFEAVGGAALPPTAPELSPMPWGEPDAVTALFAGLGVELDFAWGHVDWLFSSAEEGVRWVEEVSGPVIAAKAAMEAEGRWAPVRARLVEAVSAMTREDMDGVWVRAEYLITLGTRRG